MMSAPLRVVRAMGVGRRGVGAGSGRALAGGCASIAALVGGGGAASFECGWVGGLGC